MMKTNVKRPPMPVVVVKSTKQPIHLQPDEDAASNEEEMDDEDDDNHDEDEDNDVDDDEDEETQTKTPQQEMDDLSAIEMDFEETNSKLIVSQGAEHLREVYHRMPPSSAIIRMDDQRKFDVSHHRIQVNVQSSTSVSSVTTTQVGGAKYALFPGNKPTQFIKVIAIGLHSWYIKGDTPLGIAFECPKTGIKFPTPVMMGERSYVFTLPFEGSNSTCNTIVFMSKPVNLVNKLFPMWTEEHATKGVKEMVDVQTKSKNYLLELPSLGHSVGAADISCPLAYFRLLLDNHGKKPDLNGRTSVMLSQSQYESLLLKFRNCVSDSRVKIKTDDIFLYVHPSQRGEFKASFVIDVYFSMV